MKQTRKQTADRFNPLCLLILLTGGLIISYSVPGDADKDRSVVDANEFLLRDDQGNVRGSFGMVDGAPCLQLKNKAGKVAAGLMLNTDDVPSVFLNDAGGERLVTLTSDESGGCITISESGGAKTIESGFYSRGQGKGAAIYFRNNHTERLSVGLNSLEEPLLTLSDKENHLKACFRLKDATNPVLQMFNTKSDGGLQVGLHPQNEAPLIALYNKGSEPRIRIEASESKSAFSILDETRNVRFMAQIDSTGAPSMTLSGSDGEIRSSLNISEGLPQLIFRDEMGQDVLTLPGAAGVK